MQGDDGIKYFFGHRDISGVELQDLLPNYNGVVIPPIPVLFEPYEREEGIAARKIFMPATTKFNRAKSDAYKKNYKEALRVMNKVLEDVPDYPRARSLYHKWERLVKLGADVSAKRRPAKSSSPPLEAPADAALLLKRAQQEAYNGEYNRGVRLLNDLLDHQPDHAEARELSEKWKAYAMELRRSHTPKGKDPYTRAKRLHLVEKDLEAAVPFFYQAIEERNNTDSAIKDLAMLLLQCNRPEEAVEVIEKYESLINNLESLRNLQIQVYFKAGVYDKTIELLQEKLRATQKHDNVVQIKHQISLIHLKAESYEEAKQVIDEILKLQPDFFPARRNLALCLFEQGDFDRAQQTLNDILALHSDAKSVDLLEAITQARETGQDLEVGESILEMEFDATDVLSAFTMFFLDRSKFEVLNPERVREGRYVGSKRDSRSDLARIERSAKALGTKSAHERSEYLLLAARIVHDVGGDRRDFYSYLFRSFTSKGDSVLQYGQAVDTAREWYIEALSIWDSIPESERLPQDAVNAIVRFIASLQDGSEQVSMEPLSLDFAKERLVAAIAHNEKPDPVIDQIVYLTSRSRRAMGWLISWMYSNAALRQTIEDFLSRHGTSISGPVEDFDEFKRLWNELNRRKIQDRHQIERELKLLGRVDLNTSWLEAIEQTKSVLNLDLSDLERDRLRELRDIFEDLLELNQMEVYRDKDRRCQQLTLRCNTLLGEIESQPTKLSVEQMYDIFFNVKSLVREYLEKLNKSSVPQIMLQLAVEEYSPNDDNEINVQISVENKTGRSPAQSFTLRVYKSEGNMFEAKETEIPLRQSVDGGEQHILEIPLRVKEGALQA